MNPISYAFWWTLSMLKVWIPASPPKWVKRKMGNWQRRMQQQPIHQGITVVHKYFRGKTFVYRVTYFETSAHEIDYSCNKILRRW